MLDEAQRKDLRKTAKRLIKIAKKHPEWYTDSDVRYAKMIKRENKKRKKNNDNAVINFSVITLQRRYNTTAL